MTASILKVDLGLNVSEVEHLSQGLYCEGTMKAWHEQPGQQEC